MIKLNNYNICKWCICFWKKLIESKGWLFAIVIHYGHKSRDKTAVCYWITDFCAMRKGNEKKIKTKGLTNSSKRRSVGVFEKTGPLIWTKQHISQFKSCKISNKSNVLFCQWSWNRFRCTNVSFNIYINLIIIIDYLLLLNRLSVSFSVSHLFVCWSISVCYFPLPNRPTQQSQKN